MERPPRPAATPKSGTAFRTIGDVSAELGVAQHVLRYWEGRFPQLKPLQRAGNRRHYRPEDVDLLRRIHTLLNREGYTVRGVQKLLADTAAVQTPPSPSPPETLPSEMPSSGQDPVLAELEAIRDILSDGLRCDLSVERALTHE